MTDIRLIAFMIILVVLTAAATGIAILTTNKKTSLVIPIVVGILAFIISMSLQGYTLQKAPNEQPQTPQKASSQTKNKSEVENIIEQIESGKKYIITKDTKGSYENILIHAGYIIEARTHEETIYKKHK